jgi:hypothetical protein
VAWTRPINAFYFLSAFSFYAFKLNRAKKTSEMKLSIFHGSLCEVSLSRSTVLLFLREIVLLWSFPHFCLVSSVRSCIFLLELNLNSRSMEFIRSHAPIFLNVFIILLFSSRLSLILNPTGWSVRASEHEQFYGGVQEASFHGARLCINAKRISTIVQFFCIDFEQKSII